MCDNNKIKTALVPYANYMLDSKYGGEEKEEFVCKISLWLIDKSADPSEHLSIALETYGKMSFSNRGKADMTFISEIITGYELEAQRL